MIAALRAAEAEQDINPGPALQKLTEMLVTITERYVEGKVGELLDDAELHNVDPVPRYEPLRVASIFTVAVGFGAVAAYAGLPAQLQSLVAIGAAAFMVFVLYKRAARPMLDAIAPFLGGGAR
ncbi:hypothetical protein [Streptomyces dubilierae]|uniref:Integral membrane protein n=1 Tax=Streptomyces dubilierae TaxID=3075533 RepID=A0ABU2P1I0_9ACTN|nr:hypothetical protein [Streptomyces sp. DSM 41921]MDT0385960.1 hypothetical protein [Streptomyces sp. DSM 41921]